MERLSRRRLREDETVDPGVQCQVHMPWPPGQAPEGGRLRDDRERSLMSPDTTVAFKVEARLEERVLPVFDGYQDQLDGRTSSGDGNRNANGSGNDGSGESVPVSPSPVRRGPRQRYKSDVVEELESFFQHTPFPSREDRDLLNESTNLNQEKIKVWFQNRRARERRNLRQMGAPQDHLVFRNVAPSAKADMSRAHRSTPAYSTVTSSVGVPDFLDNGEETSEAKTETVVDTSISSSCSSSLKAQIPLLHHLPLTSPLQPSHSQTMEPLTFKSLASHGCFSTFEDYYRAYTDHQSNPKHSYTVTPKMCLSTNSPGSSWDGRSLRWNQRPSWHIPYRPYSYGSGFSAGSTFSASYKPLSLPSEAAYNYSSGGVQVLPYQNYLHQQQFSSGNSKTGLMEMGDRSGWKDEVMSSQEMGKIPGWKDEVMPSQEIGNRSSWKVEMMPSEEIGKRPGWKEEVMPSQEMGKRPGWKDEMVLRHEGIPVDEEAENGKCDLCDKAENEKANRKNPSAGLEWCSPGTKAKPLKTNWAKQMPQARKREEISNDLNAGELLMNTSESGQIQNISDVEQLGNRANAEQVQKVFENKHMQQISEMELMRNVSEMREVQSASGMEQVQNKSLQEHASAVEQMQNTPKVEQMSNKEETCNVQELEQMQSVMKVKQLSNTSVAEPMRNLSDTEKTSVELEEVQSASLVKQLQTNSHLALVYQMKRIGNTSNLPNISETNPKWNVQMAEPCGQHGMTGVAQFRSSSPMEQTQEVPYDWDLTPVQQNENFSQFPDTRNESTAKHLETSSDAAYEHNIVQVNQNWNLAETGHAGTMTETEEFADEFSKPEHVQTTSEVVVGQMQNTLQMYLNPKLFGDRSIPWTRPSIAQCFGWNRVADEDLAKTDQPTVYPLVNYQQPDEINQRSRTEFFSNLQEQQGRPRFMLNPLWSNAASRGSSVEWCRRQGTSTDSSVGQNDADDDVGHSFPPCYRGDVHFRELSTGGTYLDPNVQVRSGFDCTTGQGDWSASGQVECITPPSQNPRYLSSKLRVDEEEKVVAGCPDLGDIPAS